MIGSSGAGKSTLARGLAERLSLPLVHLDHEYWLPGWAQPTREAWRAKLARLVEAEAWVMDGNYASSFDLRLPRAEMIVFLDVPRWLCLVGILWRPLRHWGRQRPDMAPGCIERYDWPFVRYVWHFPERHRPKLLQAIATLGAHAKLVHLRSRREATAFLDSISARPEPKAA